MEYVFLNNNNKDDYSELFGSKSYTLKFKVYYSVDYKACLQLDDKCSRVNLRSYN